MVNKRKAQFQNRSLFCECHGPRLFDTICIVGSPAAASFGAKVPRFTSECDVVAARAGDFKIAWRTAWCCGRPQRDATLPRHANVTRVGGNTTGRNVFSPGLWSISSPAATVPAESTADAIQTRSPPNNARLRLKLGVLRNIMGFTCDSRPRRLHLTASTQTEPSARRADLVAPR